MTANAIRVQLPGGAVYAPALNEAASKTGARSGLAPKKAKAFSELVGLAIDTLNSGAASTITLEMQVHDDSLAAKVVGRACTSPTKKLVAKTEARAAKLAQSYETKTTKTAFTISFEV